MANIPVVENKKDLWRILGVLNVCRRVFPGFDTWVEELYQMSTYASPEVMRKKVQKVWKQIQVYNQILARGMLQKRE